MIRPVEVVALGISLRTVYRRALALRLEKPYRFTPEEVRQIMAFRGPQRRKPHVRNRK